MALADDEAARTSLICLSRGIHTAAAAFTKNKWIRYRQQNVHSHPDDGSNLSLLLVVSAGTGGCTCTSRVSAKCIVNLFPQLLSSHLEKNQMNVYVE